LRDGAAALRDDELLAVVLGAGVAGRPVGRLAADALRRTGGVRALLRCTPCEMAELPGVGSGRAARLLAAVELARRAAGETLQRGRPFLSSHQVFRHYEPRLRDLRVEQFRAVYLDGKHRVLREKLVSQGTLTTSPVHPREVFGPALRHAAAAVVLVHNHPSGDPTPSRDDVEVTRRLREVGELVGIRVVDHVVVGDGCYASLSDRGLF
jgi:DNA repair protein RadC